jgi:hypothetical protein
MPLKQNVATDLHEFNTYLQIKIEIGRFNKISGYLFRLSRVRFTHHADANFSSIVHKIHPALSEEEILKVHLSELNIQNKIFFKI